MQVGGPPGTLWISPSVLHEETNMTAIGAVGIPPFGFVIAADGRKRLDYESRAKATADHRRTKPAWIEDRAHGLVPKDIYLYPLCRNAQQRLCHDPPSHICTTQRLRCSK